MGKKTPLVPTSTKNKLISTYISAVVMRFFFLFFYFIAVLYTSGSVRVTCESDVDAQDDYVIPGPKVRWNEPSAADDKGKNFDDRTTLDDVVPPPDETRYVLFATSACKIVASNVANIADFFVDHASIGGQGSPIPEGRSCDLICPVSLSENKKTYVFGFRDSDYYKFVVASFKLSRSTVFMKVKFSKYFNTSLKFEDCTSIAKNFVAYPGIVGQVARSLNDTGIGLFNVQYSITTHEPK